MGKTTKTPSKWLRIALPSLLIVGWLALAGIGGPYFGKISEVSSTDLTTFLPKSAESTKVNEQLEKFRDNKTLPVLIVFSKDGAELSADDMKALEAVSERLTKVEGVKDKPSPPIQSDDKKAAITTVPLVSDGDLDEMIPAIKEQLAEAKLSTEYLISGPAGLAHDLRGAFEGIDGTLLLVALAVVFLILLVVYRSPLLPFIVLLTSMAALATAILIVYYLAKAGVVELNGQIQGILFILVIGAATDYSLLYLARYKEELLVHESPWRATLAALRSSFEPIVAAGGTVTVGLLCLFFSDLGSNKALGPVGGTGIILSVIAALTLLPSLLLLTGRSAFWPRRPKYTAGTNKPDYEANHVVWRKVGTLVHRHPRRTWAACILVLAIAATGVFQLKAEGVSQSNLILGYSEAREGQKVIERHFPSGSGTPMYILVDQWRMDDIVQVLDESKGIDSVNITSDGVEAGFAPVGRAEAKLREDILTEVKEKREEQLTTLEAQISVKMTGAPAMAIEAAVTAAAANIPTAEEIANKAYPFKDALPRVVDGKVLYQATLSDPADSLEARKTVADLRERVKTVDETALVGGLTAIQYDTNQAAFRDEKLVIPLILGAITIILMLLLRAIIAPLLLLFTTVLSFGATMGISALLFNHVWQFPGADPSVIIFGFVFLVALGIDYNIFLMSRVREETIKLGVSKGTIKGLVVTGGVITSAGIVLAATFAALGVIPILFLVQMAFIVAFGVLLDTFIVRSLLVPALTLEAGRFMWWPSKLWKKR